MTDKPEELKKAGLKVTVPRVKILQMLEESKDQHLSAEEVFNTLTANDEDVGLATVYRVLTQFESAGLITKHNFDGGHSVYELAQDEHHDHMVCTETGKVIEFFDEEIEEIQKKIAERHGFEIVAHDLVLYVRPKK